MEGVWAKDCIEVRKNLLLVEVQLKGFLTLKLHTFT